MPIVKVSFFNALGLLWVGEDNHPKIVFDAYSTTNERSVTLTAHVSKTNMSIEEFIEETGNRLAMIFETQLYNLMHQNNRKTKKFGKKMSKAFKDSWVTVMVLDLDKGVPANLEFEVPHEEYEEYQKIPSYFITE